MATTPEERAAEPITGSMTTKDALIVMSEGNPGAINAMMALLKGGGESLDLLHLDDMNIRGSQIWVAFKDHCGGDVEKFIDCIRSRSQGMIQTVNDECQEHTGHKAVQQGGSWKLHG